jgi:hypothetical protein
MSADRRHRPASRPKRIDLHVVLLCEHPPGVPSQIGLASGTKTERGTPDKTAHASGDQRRLAPTGLASVDPRSRLYALPGWGILVIGSGEKPSSRAARGVLARSCGRAALPHCVCASRRQRPIFRAGPRPLAGSSALPVRASLEKGASLRSTVSLLKTSSRIGSTASCREDRRRSDAPRPP